MKSGGSSVARSCFDAGCGGGRHCANRVQGRARLAPLAQDAADLGGEFVGDVGEVSAAGFDQGVEGLLRSRERHVVGEETLAGCAPGDCLRQGLREVEAGAQEHQLAIAADALTDELRLLRKGEQRESREAATRKRLRFERGARLDSCDTVAVIF